MRRAVEGGVIFFDTADVYNGGESEVVTGRLLQKLFGMREEYVARDEGARPHDARRERRAVSPASTSWPRSTPRSSASASTTSTCTRSTAGIR